MVMTHADWLLERLRELKAHPTEECVLWPFAQDSDGYGCLKMQRLPEGLVAPRAGVPEFALRGRQYYVHVLAFAFAYGAPDGFLVLHTCDHPTCFNPAHLFPGTQSTNALDARDKGLTLSGERNPGAKLQPGQVREMLRLFQQGVGVTELARRFGVGRTQVTRIVRGRKWTHLRP
jgi:hypothetical protein